ncbi:MAG: zinc-dependent alcohol dehydrogenase family protein [Cytophagales bacterium]|nr:zinc-dependent alcohol dehydrogenase family protein [Cytophagales bacterium]
MKAISYESFGGALSYGNLPDPEAKAASVVINVKATGLCRSDWHGWMGHDADIVLPHVPGHEFAGEVVEVGADIKKWAPGDRVTVPFVSGCGHCEPCVSGNQQVCHQQFQPGFTAWGSFAQYVAIDYADHNLVRLPEEMTYETAASLGCRFITAFRAIVDIGNVKGGEWVTVFGCGGVGLSAIMIAATMGAQVIAIDIDDQKLTEAEKVGACATLNDKNTADLIDAIKSLTNGGAHLSVDALGSQETCYNSIANLRTQGRQVQVGLMAGNDLNPSIPMHLVIAKELSIHGSHGMQSYRYPAVFDMIKTGKLKPEILIGDTISLMEVVERLPNMNSFPGTGVTVISV